jgi:4-hydroxy-tetrahydrodipicolinate reductase
VRRLAILGDGRMGTMVAALAPSAGFEVVAHRGAADAEAPVTRAALGEPDVVVEFTVPAAAPSLVRACARAGLPVVSGTTGWDGERDAVEAEVRASRGALLWAPNFAIGVHLFAAVVADAARRFLVPAAGFDAHLIETHHAQKLDAPSGTAKLLAERVGRSAARPVPITSVRTGHVPGTHELVLDAPFEQVRLVHEARDRRAFASGALTAATWLIGRRGVFTLDDVLGGEAR